MYEGKGDALFKAAAYFVGKEQLCREEAPITRPRRLPDEYGCQEGPHLSPDTLAEVCTGWTARTSLLYRSRHLAPREGCVETVLSPEITRALVPARRYERESVSTPTSSLRTTDSLGGADPV